MKKLSKKDFSKLTTDAKIIESDWFGPKVAILQDGNYLKLFRVKRWITSAHIFPYAKKFTRNAATLKSLNIPTVKIINEYKIPCIKKRAVHYLPLEGSTLRADAVTFNNELAHQLGRFISDLHNKGIHFRSLHFGNIILTADNQLGLIDIADMKAYQSPLKKGQRIRNFKHLSRYKQDCEVVQPFIKSLAEGYLEGSPSPDLTATIFKLFKASSSTAAPV